MGKKKAKLWTYAEWYFGLFKNMAEYIRENPYPSNSFDAVDVDFEEASGDTDSGQSKERQDQRGSSGRSYEYGRTPGSGEESNFDHRESA